MKGLLIKDVKLLLGNKQVLAILLFVGGSQLVAQSGTATPLVVAMFAFMAGMLSVTSISYDEFEDGFLFLLTLPVTRKLYVREKFVLVCTGTLFGWLLPVVLHMIITIAAGRALPDGEWVLTNIILLIIVILMLLLMLPIQLKYGVTHGRLVMFGMIAVVTLIPVLAMQVLKLFYGNGEAILRRLEGFLAGLNLGGMVIGGTVLMTAALVLSLLISQRIMEKKEF